MKQLEHNIWTHEDSMPLAGTKLGLRMTVVKLKDGGLWVHSPTDMTEQLKAQVDELGQVAFIVAASNGHNGWIKMWQSAYPDAQVHVSAGIVDKIGLENYQLLDVTNKNPWADDFTMATMPSVPFFNESVFCHLASKSLIVTDLIQHYQPETVIGIKAKLVKSLFGIIGFKGKCVAPPLKWGFVRKDKPGFSAFIEQINQWDFNKIIVTHGDNIDTDAKATFSQLCQRFG